ncbi:oligomeric complex COG6 [Novymonas esmeraldas]|uniref:Conserved oligomeric Golgi complex subunit 6 n=1 Tax=Novymonas esmeraldas TaxID=1808958 RepID=A0AAW0ERL6_9TRYP
MAAVETEARAPPHTSSGDAVPAPVEQLASAPGMAPPPASVARPAAASAKNTATQRRVAKLLDITTSSEIKDLASYVDHLLPGSFYHQDERAADDAGGVAHTAAAPSGSDKTVSSAALRTALDRRTMEVHKRFLQEFTAVYQSYQRVAAQVDELTSRCATLEDTLAVSADGSGQEAEDFLHRIQAYQAELHLVQSHDKEVDEFRKQHHFGAAEVRVLEEGVVDMNFLQVLERARQVHRRSSELMHSQEYHQGAAAVMEFTYGAIARATEKLARHLLTTAAGDARGAGGSGSGSGGGGGGVSAATGSMAADTPELTGFQLRCVRLLQEESPSLHEKLLDEVARLRRASVLRRYFHLLTTGSANTSTGVYQSGGLPAAHESGHGGSTSPGIGGRPLEAELNDPISFFSSLCAWLHQTIVEEQDFLHHLIATDEAEAGRTTTTTTHGTDGAARETAHMQALLDSVFGGVCKHVRGALESVLERLGRSAAVLGAASGSGGGASSGGGVDAGEHGLGGSASHVDAAGAAPPSKGLRTVTGRLTRLFVAATGRSIVGGQRGAAPGESSALLQRYATVTTRAQLESVAESMLHPPLRGVQTCVTLVQLFEYYTATTFAPLLGAGAALTRLLCVTAPEQTRELFRRLLRVLAAHLLDSTAGVTWSTAALRRLASSNALTQAAGGDDGLGGRGASPSAAPPASPAFVLDFLVAYTYGDSLDGGAPPNTGDLDASVTASSLSSSVVGSSAASRFRHANDGQQQRRSAHQLGRVLSQLILPPSPEVTAYCSVVHAVLDDTARQGELLGAIAEQRRAMTASEPNADHGTAAAAAAAAVLEMRSGARAFVLELLEALLRVATSVEAEATLRANLDDPCRAIIVFNVLQQLHDILERHASVLDALFSPSDATGVDARRALDAVREECGATRGALRGRLVAAWARAIRLFYFPLPAETVVAAVSSAAASEVDEQHSITVKKDVRRVLKQLVNVYNTVASLGHLPEPVPLLPALASGADVREEVRQTVTRRIVEEVYPAEFAALQALPPSEELAAVRDEMAPQNLTMLVDLRADTDAAAAASLNP